MDHIWSPAAPPVLPSAQHAPYTDTSTGPQGTNPHPWWWPELLQQVREGHTQWWDVGTPWRCSRQAYPLGSPLLFSLWPASQLRSITSQCIPQPLVGDGSCQGPGVLVAPLQVLIPVGGDLRNRSASQPSAPPLTSPGSLSFPPKHMGTPSNEPLSPGCLKAWW